MGITADYVGCKSSENFENELAENDSCKTEALRSFVAIA
ncbi:MAG: hypothetical protein Hyperionvirus2_90 [Hyperionvirus sp.]|uniref:Uncharacterized protein n=1 Tax=Hyperionvirus sp. TaxID=2487770 RepID=A0A3G5A6R0_9VIRU|nr:MAG: hypothetical protein Hyperionvirus2_90 [Hyperionvirus sp.]